MAQNNVLKCNRSTAQKLTLETITIKIHLLYTLVHFFKGSLKEQTDLSKTEESLMNARMVLNHLNSTGTYYLKISYQFVLL